VIIPFSRARSPEIASELDLWLRQRLEERERIRAGKTGGCAPPPWLEEDAAEARAESPQVRNVVWRGGGL
jgi:hypothetical protein